MAKAGILQVKTCLEHGFLDGLHFVCLGYHDCKVVIWDGDRCILSPDLPRDRAARPSRVRRYTRISGHRIPNERQIRLRARILF
jgi:hypothetical protein